MLHFTSSPIVWAKNTVAVVAGAAANPAAQFKKLLAREYSVSAEQLINKIGVTDVGEVRTNFGRALVYSGGQEHVVEIRCKEGSIRPRGVEIKLLEYQADGNFFWVERADKEQAS